MERGDVVPLFPRPRLDVPGPESREHHCREAARRELETDGSGRVVYPLAAERADLREHRRELRRHHRRLDHTEEGERAVGVRELEERRRRPDLVRPLGGDVLQRVREEPGVEAERADGAGPDRRRRESCRLGGRFDGPERALGGGGKGEAESEAETDEGRRRRGASANSKPARSWREGRIARGADRRGKRRRHFPRRRDSSLLHRVGRSRREGEGLLDDRLVQHLDRLLELEVDAAGRRRGVVLEEDVRVGPVVLDEPLPFAPPEGVVRLVDRTAVDRRLAVDDADEAAPRRDADDRSELRGLPVLDERLAVRAVVLVRQDREVGGRRAGRVGERLHVLQDVERGQLPLELVDDEVLDPAAAVAADVDDEPLAVVEGAVVAVELGDVLGPHRRQVEVPHLAAGGVLDVREVLRDPAVVAEVVLGAERLDLDDAAPRSVGRRADRELHLLALGDLEVPVRVVGDLQVDPVDRRGGTPRPSRSRRGGREAPTRSPVRPEGRKTERKT